MNGSLSIWSYGLIFASLCALLGIAAVMSSRTLDQRRLASGLFLQGVLLVFVVGAAHFQPNVVPNRDPLKTGRTTDNDRRGLLRGSSDLRLAGLAIAGLLMVQSLVGPVLSDDEQSDEDHSA